MEYRYEGNSLKSGIYKITNKLNGRIYIGSAKEFKERWKQHLSSLRNQKHSNKFLQADFNKCGEEVLVFEVIEVTDGKNKEERLLIEEGYIKQHYDSGISCYNLCNRAISREGCKDKNPDLANKRRLDGPDGKRRERIGLASKRMWAEFTPEQREHMSKEQRKKADDFWHTSKSDEAKIRASQRGKINGPASYKKAMERDPDYHETLKKRACWMEYVFLSPEGEVIRFTNLRKFCLEHNFSYRAFSEITKNCKGTCCGWSFVEKYKV